MRPLGRTCTTQMEFSASLPWSAITWNFDHVLPPSVLRLTRMSLSDWSCVPLRP